MELDKVRINHGFWKKRKDLNINSSFYAVLNSFKKSGRIRALTNEHYSNQKPHIFWESDLAKLMEGAFFTMQQKIGCQREAVKVTNTAFEGYS